AVSGILTTTSTGVTINNNYATYPDIAAGVTAESDSPHYTFTVDSGCGNDIIFTLETRYDNGSSAVSQFKVKVGTLSTVTVLNDDMESDMGWMTEATATNGLWVREDPWGVTDSAENQVQPEDDTTPSPGVKCWVTGNPRPKGNFDPTDGDVDGGYVRLISPTFDGDRAVALDMSLQRWFYLWKANDFDSSYFLIDVSNDGGSTYTKVEQLDANANNWSLVNYDLTDFINSTSSMKIRITVHERFDYVTGADSVIEGLVDDVRIERQRYECESFTPPSMLPPNPVGDTLRVTRKETHAYLTWDVPPSDASHDPATFYRIYRSLAPDSGFVEIGKPTSPFYIDVDALVTPDNYYYKVKAENSGGTSNE
ncbi:MAG: fibronectin type III domain-containing protein, partial [Acidobacteriota bacterium]